VVAVDRLGLLLVEAGGFGFTSTMSNAATNSSSENTSRSAAIDQPSSAR
jgi:hypothetical protein